MGQQTTVSINNRMDRMYQQLVGHMNAHFINLTGQINQQMGIINGQIGTINDEIGTLNGHLRNIEESVNDLRIVIP